MEVVDMIPVLYNPTEKVFNSNGLGQMTDILESRVTETRNGEFEFYGIYPVSGRLFESIKELMFIKALPNKVDEPHVFRVYETELDITNQNLTIWATTKSNDLGHNLVNEITIVDENPQSAMDKMKFNLVEPTDYTFYSDIKTKSSTKWTRRNPLNCIAGEEGSLVQYWGGEIKRTNNVISLLARRGRDNVVTIRHGKSLAGLTMNYSTKGMVTKIVPIFRFTPEGSEEEQTIVGTHVRSQFYMNYPLAYIKEVDFSQDESVTNLATLNAKASRFFTTNTGIDKPSLNAVINMDDLSDSSEYEAFKDLEKVELTDTITVYAKRYDINITAKINSIEFDSLSEKNIELEIGSVRTSLFEENERSTKDLVREIEAKLNNTIQLAANGKNKVFRGPDEPTSGMVLNDLWYKPLGDKGIVMHIYDGAYWQVEAYSADALKGTVNFANVNAINFNAANIVSGTMRSIDIEGTTITNPFDYSDGDGVRVVGTNVIDGIYRINYQHPATGAYGELRMDSRRIYSTHRNSAGRLLYSWDIGGSGINMITADGAANYSIDGVAFEPTKGEKSIINTSNVGRRLQLSSKNGAVLGVTTNDLFSERLLVGTYSWGAPFIKAVAPFDVDGNDIENIERMMFRWGKGRLIGLDSGNHLGVFGGTRLRLGVGGELRTLLEIADNLIYAYANIDMGGNTITNQSDIRLKTEVNDTMVDGIKETKRIRMIDFEWDKTNPFNDKKPEGLQFGLEAQHSRFLQTEMQGDDHYLRIDVNKQINLNTLTNKQLIEKIETLEARLIALENRLDV